MKIRRKIPSTILLKNACENAHNSDLIEIVVQFCGVSDRHDHVTDFKIQIYFLICSAIALLCYSYHLTKMLYYFKK